MQRHGQASLWLDKRGDVKLSETLTIVMRVEGADHLDLCEDHHAAECESRRYEHDQEDDLSASVTGAF